jgi:Uma2 family endonuclease
MTALAPMPIVLHLDSSWQLDDEKLFRLCQANNELRIEQEKTGDLVMMSPAGGRTSSRNAALILQLGLWARSDGRGQVFDASGGFRLGNGALRSPDAAWVETSRLKAVTKSRRDRFLPLCPTFVIELRSPSDAFKPLDAKLREYADNGTRLGWLIDPVKRRVRVYRPGREVEVLERPERITGDPEMPGLILEMAEIWDPGW